MDIHQLKYFISVAQTLNFSEAARRNGITQPSISHHIVELERQLGCQLFIRSRRNVVITEQGRAFLPYAVEIVDTAEKAAFQLQKFESGAMGHVSIASLTTSSQVLSHCLEVFSARYPNITTDITFTSGRSQVMAMNETKYDFHFAVEEMIPAGDSFEHLNTITDHLCVAFHDSNPLAEEELDFSRLRDQRFISVSENDGPALYKEIMKVCHARGYKPRTFHQFDRAEAVLLSVSAGLGISIIPEALTKVFYSDHCVFKRIDGDDALRQYVVAWRRDISTPAARLFLDVVRELYPQS